MAVIQQVQIAVKDFGRKGLIEIELTIVRAGKARGYTLAYRRVLRLFLEYRNLINTRDIVHCESVTCYGKQARQRGELKKSVHARLGLRFRTTSVLRVQSLTYQKSAVHERHLW